MAQIPEVIVGHGTQQGQLLSDIASHNIAHAYLFTGAAHIGKFSVARWFAWQILGDQRSPVARADVKAQMEKLIHPDFLSMDVLWIDGTQDDWGMIAKYSNVPQLHRSKDSPAKTDAIGIKDIETLSEKLRVTGNNPYMCCVIRKAERMKAPAANAFLKILEEPPPRVVFILTTDAVQSLLPTIISRTRIVRFAPVASEDMKPLTHGYDEEDVAFAVHMAQGAPGTLVRMLENPELLRTNKQLHSQAKQFWQTMTLKDRLGWLMHMTDKKQPAVVEDVLLHLGVALREQDASMRKVQHAQAYAMLAGNLKTNAHKGLLLQRFALALEQEPC